MPARPPCRSGRGLHGQSPQWASVPVLLRNLPSNEASAGRAMTLDTGNLHVRRGPILMKPGPPAREEGILSRHSTHPPARVLLKSSGNW